MGRGSESHGAAAGTVWGLGGILVGAVSGLLRRASIALAWSRLEGSYDFDYMVQGRRDDRRVIS